MTEDDRLWQSVLHSDDPYARAAAWLRLYARRLETGQQWDIPATMRNAFDQILRLPAK